MAENKTPSNVGRRNFLTKVAVAGAASTLPSTVQAEAGEKPAPGAQKARGAAPPSARQLAADFPGPEQTAQASSAPTATPAMAPNCGSDFMIDVLKSLNIEYVFSNPGSSFLGLHESIVTYGGNKSPEFITCMHEESAVAMANGYYKAAGRLAAAMCHGTVGLQHAAMALYNAWCDRVPLISILGNTADATRRFSGNEWRHSAQDPVAMIRDFTKWDDQPATLQAFAESAVLGYKIAMTPPMEPVALVVDTALQNMEMANRAGLAIPKYVKAQPPQGEIGALRETARLLVAAENPVIIADRMANTPEGMRLLIELSELLTVPVLDLISRQNMPTMHFLNQSQRSRQTIAQADVVLGLEVTDIWGQINQLSRTDQFGTSLLKPGAKVITIGVNNLYMKSNYQDFQRYAAVELSISGDAEATLPTLIEEVKKALTNDRKAALAARSDRFRKAHAAAYEESRIAAASGWDSSPLSTSRLCMEIWHAIKSEDWALVSVGAAEQFISSWPHRLWNFDKQYRFLGLGAGGGVGYGLPAAVGAALANKSLGRFSVNIQCDGDFMYANGALWTAAHHRAPLLTVMHNNRAYGSETMLMQGVSNRRNRGVDTARIGTAIEDPFIDYAKLAQAMGVWAEGPVTDPDKLGPALRRAVGIVKSGHPALVDVVTQMR